MKNDHCSFRLALAAVSVFTAGSGPAAQDYPSKNIRIVVPWAPGGTTDILARLVGEHLRSTLGASAIVENRPGGNGSIGTEIAARATADGYTLLMATSSTHVVSPHLMKLPYDPVKDFAPITMVATAPFLLIVNPALPATSVRELVALAKAQPGRLNFASYGEGSTPHLVAELFKSLTGITMTHVPYKGSAPVIQAVTSGEVNLAFDPLSTTLTFVKSGKLKALGVTSAARNAQIPDIPTIAEGGVAGFEANAWYGLESTKGTPAPVIAKLHLQIVNYLRSPDVQKRLVELGAYPVGNTPIEFGDLISRELAKWGRVIKQGNIKIN